MKKLFFIILLGACFGWTSCEIDPILNPNAPTAENFQDGATLADLQLLGQGLEAVIREDMQFHYWTTSIVGREYWDLRGTDPRYTSELLGQNGGALDNNGFLTTRSYFGRYRSVRNAIEFKNAVANTSATLTATQEDALMGYANTIMGYEMLLEATRQYDNGVRTEVSDIDNLGAFTGSFQASLTDIRAILDQGYQQLTGAAEPVIFALAGFSSIPGEDTEALAKFNRAIAARIAMYQGDGGGAINNLNLSFFDMMGDLDMGAYYTFGGVTGNDLPNPLFYVTGVDNYLAHPSFRNDAEAGDTRLSKVTAVADTIQLDGLSSNDQVTLYASNTASASIIRNEELILIYAEANVGPNNTEAIAAIDVIRTAAGLPAYSGGTTDDDLIDEILRQRRYSLFGEGHRWIDMRRFGRLGELPIDRPGDIIHTQFPRPASEG